MLHRYAKEDRLNAVVPSHSDRVDKAIQGGYLSYTGKTEQDMKGKDVRREELLRALGIGCLRACFHDHAIRGFDMRVQIV